MLLLLLSHVVLLQHDYLKIDFITWNSLLVIFCTLDHTL